MSKSVAGATPEVLENTQTQLDNTADKKQSGKKARPVKADRLSAWGKIPYERKKSIVGFLFTTPWLFGIIFIFLKPLIESLYYSTVSITYSVGNTVFTPVGMLHYVKAFAGNPDFIMKLTQSLKTTVYQVPVIVIFSLFMAIILNQNFKGRMFVRSTFFLPVIIASGVVISIIKGDAMSQAIMSNTSVNKLFQTTFLQSLLAESGINWQIVNMITQTVDSMFELIWKSGIQILIFLAGLQTIQPSQYEAAKIEGATGWETFWKITFPMISPMTVLNVIYTIIDSFRDYSNPVIYEISKLSKELKIEYSLAISWSYFAIIAFIIAVVYVLINRYVFYQV